MCPCDTCNFTNLTNFLIYKKKLTNMIDYEALFLCHGPASLN